MPLSLDEVTFLLRDSTKPRRDEERIGTRFPFRGEVKESSFMLFIRHGQEPKHYFPLISGRLEPFDYDDTMLWLDYRLAPGAVFTFLMTSCIALFIGLAFLFVPDHHIVSWIAFSFVALNYSLMRVIFHKNLKRSKEEIRQVLAIPKPV